MTASPCIRVWLGGSFDPIHLGHLQMIEHVYHDLCQTFPTSDIIAKLLPTAGSPLKQKPSSNEQRLAMLSLAIESMPFLSIDDYELHCAAPVYSFNTFCYFKQQYPHDILIFVVGQDSIEQIDHWYHGIELIELTNLWVLPRPALTQSLPHATKSERLADYIPQRFIAINHALKPFIVKSPKYLINQKLNHIYIDDFVVPDIASRDIRHWLGSPQLADQQKALASLPSQVYGYIAKHQLYMVNH